MWTITSTIVFRYLSLSSSYVAFSIICKWNISSVKLSHFTAQFAVKTLILDTFSSLWEQRRMPFPFPLLDEAVNIQGIQHLTGNNPNNFPWCPKPRRTQRNILLHPSVYTHHNNEWSPRTIGHIDQDESVNQTCFGVRLQHSATQSSSSRQRGGQIRKDSRLKRQLQHCHYACLPSKRPYPPRRRQKQCLLFYLAAGV